MFRSFLRAKIHGATITKANVNYQGSLSMDPGLMRLSGISPFERIDVYNLDNGERLTTYAIEGETGEFCLNGAAALKGEEGQRIIIAVYAWLDEAEVEGFKPKIVIMGENNQVGPVT